MTEKEKLYETLGELLYCVAIADGVIQSEENDRLLDLLKDHSWASEIKWSFDYEVTKNSSLEDTYNKVINFCHGYGPAPEYEEFIKSMNSIAAASDGIDKNEAKVIQSFSKDLIERFQRDIDLLKK